MGLTKTRRRFLLVIVKTKTRRLEFEGTVRLKEVIFPFVFFKRNSVSQFQLPKMIHRPGVTHHHGGENNEDDLTLIPRVPNVVQCYDNLNFTIPW